MKKVFKKSLSCLLTAVLCISLFVAAVPASAVTPTYSTNAIEAKAGDAVNIDFAVSNFINVQGALIRFNLPSAIGSVESVKLNGEDFEAYNPDTGTGYYQIGQEDGVYYVKFLSLFGAELGELDSMETLTFNIAATVKADAAAQVYEYPAPVFSVTEDGETLVDVTGTFGTFEVVEDVVEPEKPVRDESLASVITAKRISIDNTFGIYFALALAKTPYDDFEFVVSKPEIVGPSYNYTGNIISKTFTKETCDENSMPQYHGYYITYSDIALSEMSVPITFTLYVTKDGATRYYTYEKLTLSQLANEMYQSSVNSSNVTTASLMVDMLNLGTEAQLYFGKTGAPGNPLISEFDIPNANVNQDYATNYGKLTDIGGRRDSQFTAVRLQMLAVPSLYYTFLESDHKTPADLTFTASYYSKADGEEKSFPMNGADLSEDELKYSYIGGYSFSFDKMALFDTDKKITLTISDTQNNSWVYETSVESLLAGMVEVESEAQALYRATAAFGASEVNYWPNY